MENKKNSSLWPKWDVIFSDILDLLVIKNRFLIRSLFLLILFFLFFILFLVFIILPGNHYDSGIGLNWNIEFCDQMLWLLHFIYEHILAGRSILLYYNIVLYFYLNSLYFGVMFFLLDYIGLYLFIEVYFYNVVQNDLNFVYTFDVLSYYKYNYIYNKIYTYDDYSLIYSYISFFSFDYRYLTIKSVVHNLFLLNLGTDLLTFFYDISFLNRIIFVKTNLFNYLNVNVLNKKIDSILTFVVNDNDIRSSYMLEVINEFFVNVVHAQYYVKNHFTNNFSVFHVKNVILFLIKMPYINFDVYSVIYLFSCDFINVITCLLNVYLINILLYYNVIVNMAIYNIGNLTDVFCYQIFMLVIFWEN